MNFHFVKIIEAYWSSFRFILPICFCYHPGFDSVDPPVRPQTHDTNGDFRASSSCLVLTNPPYKSRNLKRMENVEQNGSLTMVPHFLRRFWILTEIFQTSPFELGRQWKYIRSYPHWKHHRQKTPLSLRFASFAPFPSRDKCAGAANTTSSSNQLSHAMTRDDKHDTRKAKQMMTIAPVFQKPWQHFE